MARYFLGVDGGQSNTTALIGDEAGRILGAGRGGPVNHVGAAKGRARFVNAVEGALSSARGQAGLGDVRFTAACFGLSGGPADKEALLREIVPADQFVITHDAFIALSGATEGAPGIITIAGTGSIAFGRNAAGKTARAGGWGHLFGDEGGGFDLVRGALRAALQMEESWGPPTILRERLLTKTGAEDANSLLHRFYTDEFTRSRIAAYARLVDCAAEEGDAVARELLNRAAQQLASLTAAVRGQLFAEKETAAAAYAGGVFQSRLLLERYCLLVELGGSARLTTPRYSPAAGALLEAYRAAGVRCPLGTEPEPGR